MTSKWEIMIERHAVQTHPSSGAVRTVGGYRVLHNGTAAESFILDGEPVPLWGTTAESPGPSQNHSPATEDNPSRILPRRYPLATSGGPTYKTNGYRADHAIAPGMPGIELMDTAPRYAILIHPGKNQFLSSIGCINLCTDLPHGAEKIDYIGSRRRVIALIEDMRQFFGGLPGADCAIPNASAVIAGDP
jgi:hypothetical protein